MDGKTGFAALKPQVTEMTQFCRGLQDIASHRYKISIMIRRPVPHDRFTKFDSINISHYDVFDQGHIQNYFPSASEVLRLRLAKSMKHR